MLFRCGVKEFQMLKVIDYEKGRELLFILQNINDLKTIKKKSNACFGPIQVHYSRVGPYIPIRLSLSSILFTCSLNLLVCLVQRVS